MRQLYTIEKGLRITEVNNEVGFNIIFEDEEDKREEIAKLIVDGGFGLLEFRPITLRLEDVFRELTTEEKAA
jgi:hypothetical protein